MLSRCPLRCRPAMSLPPPANATPALAPSHVAAGAAPTADASGLTGHGAAIDTRADNWHEALASRVQVLVDQHVGEAHIKLNPPELGAVDIKISLVDDKTFVQLTAANSAARDELTQSLPRLRELLSASGLSLGGASVHGGSAGQNGGGPAPRLVVPAYMPFAGANDEFERARPRPVRPAASTYSPKPAAAADRHRPVETPIFRRSAGAHPIANTLLRLKIDRSGPWHGTWNPTDEFSFCRSSCDGRG